MAGYKADFWLVDEFHHPELWSKTNPYTKMKPINKRNDALDATCKALEVRDYIKEDLESTRKLAEEIMLKNSYLCGRCQHHYKDDALTCVMCSNGSNFIEQRTGSDINYAVIGRAQGKTLMAADTVREMFGGVYLDKYFSIERVIFNEPATIIFWKDGTKTVVKCQGDEPFDPEKGMAMAIAKRAYGDKGSFNNVINKYVEPYLEQESKELREGTSGCLKMLGDALNKGIEAALNAPRDNIFKGLNGGTEE